MTLVDSVVERLLITLSNDAITERQRAELEAKIFLATPRDMTIARNDRQMWVYLPKIYARCVALQCGGRIRSRSILLGVGSLADPLWSLVDGPERCAVGTAVRLLTQARVTSNRRRSSLASELRTVIEAYHKDGIASSTRLGKSFRRRVGSPTSERPPEPTRTGQYEETLEKVRDTARHYVTTYAGGLEARRGEQLLAEIVAEIDAMFWKFMLQVDREQQKSLGSSQESAPNLRMINEACEVLTISRPIRSAT